ncbi:MAG: N-acetylmuramoyl-L-alanine amidase [Chloroflexaceae bacterium]|nr:N-acetylmuramoyl-L-alanine amidase [Chloroflexaceae bacterium]
MNRVLGATLLGILVILSLVLGRPGAVAARSPLFVAYPPNQHQTVAEQIFLIGSAPPAGDVFVNNQRIERSPAGHFAPSFPLALGENRFRLSYGDQEIELSVTRLAVSPAIPQGAAFAENSLIPSQPIARLSGESICFSAIAAPEATVTVRLGTRTIPLQLQPSVELPANNGVLTGNNQIFRSQNGQFQGCTRFSEPGNLETPIYQLNLHGERLSQPSPATVTILSPDALKVVAVTAEAGVARTGPGSDYSRLTPLPQGAQAAVTGQEGEWLRLDYGAWIRANETQAIASTIPPQSLIRGITSRQLSQATEIVFPLQVPVPITVQQSDSIFTLTLHHAIAQTDTIRLNDDPLIKRLDWQQVTPTQVQYQFQLKTQQQWGYGLRYEDTTLILTLRHPPSRSLRDSKILLDPGHGGEEFGARGPDGTPEKDINLIVSKLLQTALEQRGTTVYLTRESDRTVSLVERVKAIERLQPTLALSIHYNALPDGGDALNTAGIGMFWYHPQAHNLAIFLHNYLVKTLSRPSYGVFWNNLALTRPHTAPSLLLELGFMINPLEFEWITNPLEQQRLANAIADGMVEWFASLEQD